MLAGVSGSVWAEGEDTVVGNAEQGEQLVQMCAGCHGQQGQSTNPSFPKLAGQGEKYLLKQLQDIKSGARVVTQMTGMLSGFNDQQMADIAAYYSVQEKTVGTADPELVEIGRQLYRGGNLETGVPACAACHSPDGSGIELAAFPMLSGQHAEYTASQLHKFKRGYRAEEPTNEARTNDGESKMMRTTAFRLKDFEIEALASYINGLH